MTRKPDDVKKGLECCVDGNIVCAGNCVFDDDVKLGYPDCVKLLMTNALSLIQQLETDKQQLEGMLTHMNQLRDAAAGRALKMEERAHQLDLLNLGLLVEKAQLEAERDAAVKDMYEAQSIVCLICKNYYQPDPAVKKYGCKVLGEHFGEGSIFCGMFEWRGVQKEDGNA